MLDYRYNTFLTLVETKNYTKTAELMNFTQPAVTRHIQFIEKSLGVTLVKYQDKTLTITQEGLYLYDKINYLQSEILQIKAHLTHSDSLKIGASKTIGEYWLQKYLSKYYDQYPESTISLMVDNTTTLLSLIKEHKIDLALISGPVNDSRLHKTSFFEDNILCVCSKNNLLANTKVPLHNLINETIILREKGSGITDAVTKILSKTDTPIEKFKLKQYVGNINLIKQMISQNQGITFIYESAIEKELKENEISQIFIKDIDLKQPFYIVMNNKQSVNDSTQFFIDSIFNIK